jgi:hypothetical protein
MLYRQILTSGVPQPAQNPAAPPDATMQPPGVALTAPGAGAQPAAVAPPGGPSATPSAAVSAALAALPPPTALSEAEQMSFFESTRRAGHA